MMRSPKTLPAEKQPAPPSLKNAAAIATALADAEAKLTGLQHQREDIALQSLQSGDEAALAAIDAEIASLNRSIVNLRDSHKGAVRVEEAARQAAKAAQYKSEIRSVKTHLGRRDVAARAFVAAMAEAIKQWRAMLEEGKQAAGSTPALGFPVNMKTYCDLTRINELVSKEIARLGGWDGQIGADRRAFPGAHPHDISMLGQPEKLPPLVDVLEDTSRAIIDAITGKADAQ